jgi:hypothetical protein
VEWEEIQVPDKKHPKVMITKRWAQIEVEGETPKMAGWTLAAKIEPTEAGNLVKLVPGGGNVPEQYYQASTTCDHCQKARYRTEVFVLSHEDGRWAQVGRNCIADFLGGTSPERLAGIAEWGGLISSLMDEAEDEGWSYGRAIDRGEPTERFVAAVAAFARFEGYVSRKAAQIDSLGEPTSARAWRFLRPIGDHDKRWLEKIKAEGFEIEERDVALATKAIAWAKALEPNYDQNFLANLKVAASLEYTDGRSMGIVSAVVGSYMREVEREELRRKERETRKPSHHVGEQGKRSLFKDVTVASFREFEPQNWYESVRTLITFIDNDGNIMKWWTGIRPDWVEQGVTASIKGTVKAHEEYKGEPQTVLTRVAVAK